MRRSILTLREIKKLANKLEKFTNSKKATKLGLTKREIEIITLTRYLYNTDKECQQDKICKYMYDLTTKTFDKIHHEIDNFIKELA